MSDKFILNAKGEPIPEPDLVTWGRWMQTQAGIVKQEVIGGSRVSTVFLGLNHNYGEGPPIFWETMVFGGLLNGEQERCSGSREQAEAMHALMCEKVRNNK